MSSNAFCGLLKWKETTMFKKLRAHFADVLSHLEAIAVGLHEHTARTVELPDAVGDVATRLDGITVAIQYIEKSERTKNHRAGITVH
jgi:hypothetical protein